MNKKGLFNQLVALFIVAILIYIWIKHPGVMNEAVVTIWGYIVFSVKWLFHSIAGLLNKVGAN